MSNLNIEEAIEAQRKVITYDTFDFTVELLLNKFSPVNPIVDEDKDVFIPDYQRNFVWKDEQKARFIESVILGLPIPIMFFAKTKDNNMEIIDGSQRIRTLYDFYNNKIKLMHLKKLDMLNNFRYSDLPLSQKKNFKNSILRVAVINNATSEIKKDLFDRINTSSTKAEPMEVRIGSHTGKFMDFILSCAQNKTFISLTPMSNQLIKKRNREELVLRLFAYAENLSSYSNNVKNMLDKYLEQKNDKVSDNDIFEYQRRFDKLLEFVKKNFPHGFRIKNLNSKNISRIEFEAIAIGSYLALLENPQLDKVDTSWLNNTEFINYVTTDGRSNTNERVLGRIGYVKTHLLGENG